MLNRGKLWLSSTRSNWFETPGNSLQLPGSNYKLTLHSNHLLCLALKLKDQCSGKTESFLNTRLSFRYWCINNALRETEQCDYSMTVCVNFCCGRTGLLFSEKKSKLPPTENVYTIYPGKRKPTRSFVSEYLMCYQSPLLRG